MILQEVLLGQRVHELHGRSRVLRRHAPVVSARRRASDDTASGVQVIDARTSPSVEEMVPRVSVGQCMIVAVHPPPDSSAIPRDGVRERNSLTSSTQPHSFLSRKAGRCRRIARNRGPAEAQGSASWPGQARNSAALTTALEHRFFGKPCGALTV